MTRQLIAGAWYGDHLPSGAWVALIPHVHCLTHLGIVPLPPGESFGPGFVRCTDVGGFKFAGQAHDTTNPACWEWDQLVDGWADVASGWMFYAPPCVGVSPVIYDREGVLHRSDGSIGSQGYRYVDPDDGLLVSGDQSYGPWNGLFERTYLGDGLWIGQGATDGSGVRVWDGTTLRQHELGYCVFIRGNSDGETVALAFFDGELNGVVREKTTMAELRALPPVVTPPPPPPPDPTPEPIGPRSEPLPDGTVIPDLLRYVLSKPEFQPRIGPSHSMGQKIRGQWWDKVKFAFNELALRTGKSYETWFWTLYWICQHSDASAYDPYQQTDQRMFPRRMQIGEAFAFKTPPHEIVWKKRPGDPGLVSAVSPSAFARAAAMQFYRFGNSVLRTAIRAITNLFAPCQETQRQPWGRKMWVQAVWPQFYCGPDLGIRAVAMLVYDATAGIREPGRYIEAGFYALDAGDIAWEPHKAWLMYLTSSSKAVFDDTTRADRKEFYLIGGPDPDAQRLGCFPEVIPTTPEYGPWNPTPKPDPPKPPASSLFQHKGVTMEYDGKIVVARGFKGMLIRPDAPGTGIWGTIAEPKGTWRGGLFDSVDAGSDECRYRVSKHPNGTGRYILTNIAHNCVAGADFGEFTPSINQGFYHKPTGNTDAGDLEQWRVYEGNQNGAIEAQVEQATSKDHPAGEGKKFFGYPLSLEVVG